MYIVMDIGCLECGVSTEVVGVFDTREAAEAARDARTEETKNWREGGQTSAEVFEWPSTGR